MQLNWLVLDDEPLERLPIVQALNSQKQIVFEASTPEEARDILREKQINICLFDFHLGGREKTSEILIAELRRVMPSMPIIICTGLKLSGQNVTRFKFTGADLVIKKCEFRDEYSKLNLFASGISIHSARQARFEALAPVEEERDALYLTAEAASEFEIQKRKTKGKLLVIGQSGTGKTVFAKALARETLKYAGGTLQADFRYLNCEGKSEIQIENEIFGDGGHEGFWKFNIFEANAGGIVIIDNLHALSHATQRRLIKLFSRGVFVTAKGALLSLSEFKFVFTYQSGEETRFYREFLRDLDADEVVLPTLKDAYSEFAALINFLVGRECKRNNSPPLSTDDRFIAEFLAFVKREPIASNFRSLSNMIREFVTLAHTRNERVLSGLDERFYTRYSTLSVGRTQEAGKAHPAAQHIASLSRTIERAENFEKAHEILTQALLVSGVHRFGNNPNEICNSLIISRKHLYRLGYMDLKKR